MLFRALENTFAKIVKLWKAQPRSTGIKIGNQNQLKKIMSNPYEGDSLTTTPTGLTARNTAQAVTE
jgi:hypothetical protein